MNEKKNYLNNEDLRNEILKCIDAAYNKAISLGYKPECKKFESDNPKLIENYNAAIKLGYIPERTNWISKIRDYDPEETKSLVNENVLTQEEYEEYSKWMDKPIVSDKLGKMFQIMVENVSRSFFWQNPDDGLDCKANALLDLCSNFWKYEPASPETGKTNSAFAFCTQIAYFGIAGAHRILHPKKYDGTISMSCLDENGKIFELYNI